MNEKNIVYVQRYLLNSNDEQYNKEEINFKGMAQIPTMINNIASYSKRTKLIMDFVIKEIKLDDNRQILILSDRKQHLEDMYNLAIEGGIESVGYYVGGMKKEKLKTNESCKILLGTYPMANEGLDIPSLNGLVLSTPKSDIIQSVGRISRVKHDNIQPIILDIVDLFSIFESQSNKRLAVYKKKKYQVKDIIYDLDKNIIKRNKEYTFHKSILNDEYSDDSSEDIVDTEYDNIDSFTNKKVKTLKKNVKKDLNQNIKKDDFNEIFNSVFIK
jgi:superfamily II DNA or RNA helicase